MIAWLLLDQTMHPVLVAGAGWRAGTEPAGMKSTFNPDPRGATCRRAPQPALCPGARARSSRLRRHQPATARARCTTERDPAVAEVADARPFGSWRLNDARAAQVRRRRCRLWPGWPSGCWSCAASRRWPTRCWTCACSVVGPSTRALATNVLDFFVEFGALVFIAQYLQLVLGCRRCKRACGCCPSPGVHPGVPADPLVRRARPAYMMAAGMGPPS